MCHCCYASNMDLTLMEDDVSLCRDCAKHHVVVSQEFKSVKEQN